MLEVKEIKLFGVENFAVWKEPIYFLNYKDKNYRQVFYNPGSDYGYWLPGRALDYTSYINSQGNMEDWKPGSHKFLLFYDVNPPKYFKGYHYLLFVETKKLEVEEYEKTFDQKVFETTKELINCNYQVSIYNKRRTLDNIIFHKDRELQKVIEEYKRFQEWQKEEELKNKEWRFKSNSDSKKMYQVKYKKYNGKYILSCSCSVWIFNHRKDRTCKHTDEIVEMGNEYSINKMEVC